jgi:hypothetical protein
MMMDEIGGLDSFTPSEGEGGASEAISEAAKQRFAGAQQALQQIRKEEKKARKRDDNVAHVILQFLTDEQRTHLATLIARLVAINCPSHFILAILSLINQPCAEAVMEYLRELNPDAAEAAASMDTSVIPSTQLDATANKAMADWIGRIDGVLMIDAPNVLRAIVIEENNIDGTVLQLTTFVLQEFLEGQGKSPPFEKLQPVAVGILQSVLGPHMQAHMERRIAEAPKEEE